MQNKIVMLKAVFCEIMKRCSVLLSDIHGEYTFKVDGCEITATFSEEYNYDLLPRLKEILIENPHIRHEPTTDSRIKKNIKEAV